MGKGGGFRGRGREDRIANVFCEWWEDSVVVLEEGAAVVLEDPVSNFFANELFGICYTDVLVEVFGQAVHRIIYRRIEGVSEEQRHALLVGVDVSEGTVSAGSGERI